MLDVLRQMTRTELAEVFALLGEPLGPPEEVPRALAGSPWLLRWGPGDPERFVLTRAAQALGMTRELQQRHWTTGALERRVYAALCAQALGSAEGSARAALLAQLGAAAAVSADDTLPEEARQAAALRACLGNSAGLRAFAVLPAALDLAPQFDLTRPAPLALLAGMVSPAACGGSARALAWSRWGRGLDLRALFRTLTLCWRARQRLLLEQRAEAARLEGEIRELLAALRRHDEEGILERRALPWYRQPASALAIASGATVATLLQTSALGEPHALSVLTGIAACAGFVGSVLNWEASRLPARRALLSRLLHLRRQLTTSQRQITILEQ
jgi:hypothetical protein